MKCYIINHSELQEFLDQYKPEQIKFVLPYGYPGWCQLCIIVTP